MDFSSNKNKMPSLTALKTFNPRIAVGWTSVFILAPELQVLSVKQPPCLCATGG
jgi:hypothetical protein